MSVITTKYALKAVSLFIPKRFSACRQFIISASFGSQPEDESKKQIKTNKCSEALTETPEDDAFVKRLRESIQEFQYEPFEGGVNPATGEIGGPRGPEPTRYGDWERKGQVVDF